MAAGAQAAVLPVCDVCGSDEEVHWFCQDCQEKLCIKCKTAHQGSRKTKNDEIVPITEVKQQDTPKIVPVLCQEHKTKICELHCKKCEQLICSQCLNIKHKSHPFDSVEKFIESKTSELDDFEKHLHNKLSSYENVISEESQQHSDFISHVDKLMVEVKDESDKIIQEFTETRDKHISDLSHLKKRAEEKYKKIININQTKTSVIRKSVDDVKKAKTSGNAHTMIETVNELKQNIPSIVVPFVSHLPLPCFQHNACQPSSILQLDIPDIEVVPSQQPPVIGKVKVSQQPPVIGKVKVSQQPPVMPVSQTGAVASQPTIDMNKVKVRVDIQVKGKKEQIHIICPTDNNQAWIVMHFDHHFILIDTNGCIVRISANVGGEICDAMSYYTDLLCTTVTGHCVMRVRKDGDSVTTFSDLSPFYTRGLCVTSDKDILVCLSSTTDYHDSDSRVVRLNDRGEVIQEIQHNNQQPMFSYPVGITSPGTGDVVVVDWVSPGVKRVICTDRSGNHRYTWTGQVGGRKKLQSISLANMTHNNNSVYLTDSKNHCVFVLDRNGKAEQFVLNKNHGIKEPLAITTDNSGRLWIGCYGAKLYILE